MVKLISQDEIGKFIQGRNDNQRIIKMECAYNEDKVSVIYKNEKGEKRIRLEKFLPFCWATEEVERKMFGGNMLKLANELGKFGIARKRLRCTRDDGSVVERLKKGYNILFYAYKTMSMSDFSNFFKNAGTPLYPKTDNPEVDEEDRKNFVVVSPIEQHMISTGQRLFKGYDDYDSLDRLEWDLETEGLDPNIHMISQIGIRLNSGFEKVIQVVGETREEKFENELKALEEMFEVISKIIPDVMTGHNTENFDWVFVDVRLKKHGTSLEKFSLNYFRHKIYKSSKESVLKLGGEVEYYKPTIFWGVNITDSLQAVRRAQALDSSMKKSDLKYVTIFSKLNKPNRVYVPGKKIDLIWRDTNPNYAFNNTNGDWYKISEKKPLKDGYEIVTGRYIVERYLLDDLYEGDKVELRYNQSNFLVCKMLPISYERVCTMGTAGMWRYIMLSWSYETGLAIPLAEESRAMTGGLSRLFMVGFVDNVAKLDYNSMYPSIALSFDIFIDVDVMNVMPSMLEYILTQREHYKALKKKYGKIADAKREELSRVISELKSKFGENYDYSENETVKTLQSEIFENDGLSMKYDKMQLPLKIFGNSWFGSVSSSVFNWNEFNCGEQITCTGRMMFRLLVQHFKKLGYTPIVGDSVTKDTPVFIKYDDTDMINIVPIEDLFSVKDCEVDCFGREYDTTAKKFKVLCRSGWVYPNYVYRHKTTKPIYKISNGDVEVDCTEDHSLFNSDKVKIKPSDVTEQTRLEYYDMDRFYLEKNGKIENIVEYFDSLLESEGEFVVPMKVLNSNKETMRCFLDFYDKNKHVLETKTKTHTKTLKAGLLYLKNMSV